MRKDDEIRLRHMYDAACEVASFVRGRARADFDNDRLLLLGVVKELEIIGEAAVKVSDDTKTMYPEIPWAEIVGMRHRLIHAYFDINVNIVWQTVTADLPPLASKLESALFAGAGD